MSVIDYLPEVTSEPETFAAIDDVMAALESVPGVLEGRNEIRAANEQMEREYLIGLATIRKVAALTQDEVAVKMGIKQAAVSKIERRDDMLLSTMKAYFDAVGAEATITIRVGGIEHRASLAELTRH